MLIPFGVLSAAGAGGGAVASDYELIETVLLSSSQSSVTFSNLGNYSSTYKHLQLRYTARSDRNVQSSDAMIITLNGDSGSNYNTHMLQGNGSTVTSDYESGNLTAWDYSWIAPNAAPSNIFGSGVFDILDSFSTTKFKTRRSLSSPHSNSGNTVQFTSGLWRNTASITSITFDQRYGSNFVAGSRFSIYGIRG